MIKRLRALFLPAAVIACGLYSTPGAAQQSGYDVSTELELGAIVTSGNNDHQNIKFKGQMTWLRDNWDYNFSLDGYRSSREGDLAAQRLYTVAGATHTFADNHFVRTRAAHEDDRFSGFESQSDITVSYGREVFESRDTLYWDLTVGGGTRYSQPRNANSYYEPIVRLASEFEWTLSDNALFSQSLSTETGEESTISRAEAAIESNVMENMSLKFAVNVKHQSVVPASRKKMDTELSVTLLIRL